MAMMMSKLDLVATDLIPIIQAKVGNAADAIGPNGSNERLGIALRQLYANRRHSAPLWPVHLVIAVLPGLNAELYR